MMRRSFIILTVLALVAVGCSSGSGNGPTTGPPATSGSTSTMSPPAEGTLPMSLVSFGKFSLVPLLGDGQAYAGPDTPKSLDGVEMAASLRRLTADPAVAKALETQGFAIVPADFERFHMAYEGNVYDGWPVFVTTDAAYHTWHLVFDKILRSVEQEVLLPKLETLVGGLLDAARAQADELKSTPLADRSAQVVQLFQVAAAELGIDAGTLGPLAVKEKALIDEHAESTQSPVTGTKIDYTLFTPRGHYTRNADLTRFFVAMSVLGQSAFCLPSALDCPGTDPLRLAVLASRVLVADPVLSALWRDLYEPTAFLVGTADDYTPFEVADAAKAVTPDGLVDPSAFANDATMTKLADALAAKRPVQIDPERASVRLMGTRFVIDSWILDQLLYPNVGTEAEPRVVPSPLDLAAAFGSDVAYGIQEAAGETKFANYDEQLSTMSKAVASRPDEAWGATVYDAWLSALEPMWTPHGKAFPDFMQTDAWARKDLQTGTGSYAELKHDTILYTKQAVAEGGDVPPPLSVRNWVEPDPVAFSRLGAMVDLMREGLASRDLSTSEQDRLLGDVSEMFAFFSRIATDELAGKPIKDRDNQRLEFIGGELESLWLRTSDRADGSSPEADEQAALIADIASSPAGILEIGTGRIDRILVLVPDDQGNFQLAAGGVYSYYEFVSPSERLTDESWRAMLSSGDAPARPAWEPVVGA